jgi:UDP-N-acetylglucosamine acyltransferase
MIHSTAQVHPEARLDPSVQVGPWCLIGPHVKIGKGTELKSHVVIEGWTEVGEENVIFPFAVLGAIPQDLKYKGEQTYLTVGNRNVIREGVTINLGTAHGGNYTRVGDDNLIMSYVHLGHDCQIANHCVLATHAGLSGHVDVRDYAIIGGMAGITQFARIGEHSYIGGQAGITKDVPPFSIVEGNRPPTIRGVNIVGLRRRGLSAETITKLNETVKLWTRPEVPKEQCLLEIESQYGDVPEVESFLKFIKESEIGVTK